MTVAKNPSVKKPQDHKAKAETAFITTEVEIDGVRYPVNPKLTFAQNLVCEEATGKGYTELSPISQFGVTAWLAMRAAIPSMTWDAFSENTSIENVNFYNNSGVSMTEWAKNAPKA